MHGDFSVLNFDPHEHERGVEPAAQGLLRNVSGVLHQQGRVTTDADLTEGELLELGWNGQAGRDIIGAGVCAVPAQEPAGFHVDSAFVTGGEVHVTVRPGRAWVDGILTRLAGTVANPTAAVEREATYLGPPIATPQPTPATIGDGVRDAVILEVSEEALHGFQYPQRLIEPALGGPDTSERAFVNARFRLLRLANGEDCSNIGARLRDDPSAKGHLTASLAPTVALGGDCPVVGGGGYTGFEHHLFRIEIAETGGGAVRFKWSQENGGLAGRGRFDATVNPAHVTIDAGRAAIVHSNVTEFYLEALQYDELAGTWNVVYGAMATLTPDNDLDLTAPPVFGTLPSTSDPVFFRLWNGIENLTGFTNALAPVELQDGIRLVFDAPANGNYRPGDYWTFPVRAGEIANPEVLIDDQPPVGVVYHRVPLAEINWTGRLNTDISGTIEDCRKRFRPLTNQKICCTFLIGDGQSSFGDFNSLEEAAAHLPPAGGELCLLPGLHRANLRLEGRRNITIHGCARRSLVLPRTETRFDPILRFVDCVGVRVHDVDLLTYDGIAVLIEGRQEGSCRDVRIHDTRMIARVHCIRAYEAAELHIANNRLHLLDTVAGLTTISLAADDSLVERNTLVMLPFIDTTPNDPDIPDDDPTRDPADPCARPEILYLFPQLVLAYAIQVWTFVLALLVPKQPYRAIGGIHLRAGCERVRLLENHIVGGAGNGITLGGDLDPAAAAPAPRPVGRDTAVAAAASAQAVAVNIDASGQFLALVQNEAGAPQASVDVYLEASTADASTATDRSDGDGLASVKAKPGRYLLDVAPKFSIVRVTETRDQGVLVNAITVAPRAVSRDKTQAFLHEITIEANDVSMMGLSGIGFALRAGAVLPGTTAPLPSANGKTTLLTFADAALLNFAVTPVLRATHPVRDLVIFNNRLHHNLLNPFSQQMLAEAQQIGRGGVSLAIVESAAVYGNHINDNGVTAINPACGVFIAWGNDIEITDNTLADNGAITADYEENRRAGLRGGIYVRFAGALTAKLSSSNGRKAALRVHDNRVDQPAGRALTAFAFGPVSIVNNHLSSAFTGRFGFIDTAFGATLVGNLGGVHRLIARLFGNKAGNSYSRVAEAVLPGGETIYDDNFVRLDEVNRSIMAQGLLCMDDLGYASNTSSVYRGDPFFCNTVLIGDTLRATGGRLREEATRTLSMLTLAIRANITTHNQADHCIFALPPATGPHVPRTVEVPNHVFDSTLCRNADGAPASVGSFAAPALSANAAQLGGPIAADAFSETEVNTLATGYTTTSIAHVNTTQVAVTRAYQAEAVRLEAKLGADHPKTMAMNAQAEAGVVTQRVLATSAEAGATTTPDVPDAGSALSGRLVNTKGQGQPGYTIVLVSASGAPAATVGRTDGNGGFGASFDANETARLAKLGKLLPRVLDANDREVLLSKDAVTLAAGADVQITLTLPVRVVPRSVVQTGTVLFAQEPTPTPAPPTPTPSPTPTSSTRPPTPTPSPSPTTPTPTPPATTPRPTPPPPTPSPTPPSTQPPAIRTPLEKLDIDDTMRKRLREGGILDVEAILEIDPAKLAKIAGDAATANKLIEMARALLAGASPSAPPKRTGLGKLDIDDATRRRLRAGNIVDVEGILEADEAKLSEIAGDRATASRLREMSKALIGGAAPPATSGPVRPSGRSAAKKTPRKKT
jgi:hypothetical protein